MAGTAQTTRFLMGTATLMFGAMSAAFDLLPATNSVGLVKNFQISSDPKFTDLTQGSKNQTVFSTLTGNDVKAQAEVYEYTAQNLTYGLSLDGTSVVASTATNKTLTADTVANASTISVNNTTGLAVGNYVMLQNTGTDDVVTARKITSIASLVITLDQPLATVWPMASTTVIQVNAIDLGSTVNQPFLSCKAVGALVDGTICEIILPKVRIVKGFTLGFNSEQYGNLPYEIEVMDLVPTDTFYSSFSNKKGSIYLP